MANTVKGAELTDAKALKAIQKEKNKKAWKRDFNTYWGLYVMFIPVLLFYLIFCYAPMYGVIIAFERYTPAAGVFGSTWLGFDNFKNFFKSFYFLEITWNTFRLSLEDLIFGFPASIVFALMLNEVKHNFFKKPVQTISYLPYFISTVVVGGLIIDFCAKEGLINDIIVMLGGEASNLLMTPKYFDLIYVASGIWQGVGYGSIIYLGAISGINSELYEAATIDGAGRIRQTFNVTIPGIAPTIIIMFILRMGSMLSIGYEKILLLQNGQNLQKSEVISTFVYKRGLIDASYGYAAAVGLFNSAVNLVFLVLANTISRKVSETSLW